MIQTVLLFALLLFGCQGRRDGTVRTESGTVAARNISYMLWLPDCCQSRRPLVVISHGFGGKGTNQAWLARGLVDEGYIVATLDHPDWNYFGRFRDIWERPLDISALLDELESHPLIDQESVGVVGYSMGALTGLWLGGAIPTLFDREHILPAAEDVRDEGFFVRIGDILDQVDYSKGSRSYRDERVRSVALLAPAWAWVFDERGFEGFLPPLMIIAGSGDEVINTERNGQAFARWVPHCRLRPIPDRAGHFIFLNMKRDPPSHKAYLFVDPPGVDRLSIHQDTLSAISQFFRETL